MPLLLVIVFIVVPIAELYVLIQIGQAIGVLPTIAILILDSVLGAALMRSQGRAAWMRFNRALAEGRVPGREIIDGVLVIFGGALLLTPGFLTDILGLTLLLPPTRAVVRGVLVRRFGSRLVASAADGVSSRFRVGFGGAPGGRGGRGGPGGPARGSGPGPGGTGRPRPRPRASDDDVVEGTATEVPPQRDQLP